MFVNFYIIDYMECSNYHQIKDLLSNKLYSQNGYGLEFSTYNMIVNINLIRVHVIRNLSKYFAQNLSSSPSTLPKFKSKSKYLGKKSSPNLSICSINLLPPPKAFFWGGGLFLTRGCYGHAGVVTHPIYREPKTTSL